MRGVCARVCVCVCFFLKSQLLSTYQHTSEARSPGFSPVITMYSKIWDPVSVSAYEVLSAVLENLMAPALSRNGYLSLQLSF